jgi:GR25 family glycosyltransferase involved in LPS biosynthesis
MDINSFFDKIFYINLDKDIERNQNMISQFSKFKINNYERISGTIITEVPKFSFWRNFNKNGIDDKYILGSLGCRNSHWRIAKIAIERGYKKIMILEDDVNFIKDPNELLKKNADKINNWDMLYFGGEIESNFRNQIVGAYAYALNENMIHEVFNMLPFCGMEVDNFYAKVLQHASYNYNETGKYLIKKLQPFNSIVVDYNYGSNIRTKKNPETQIQNNPFDFFDKIFYINLDDRTDRNEAMQKLFKKYQIKAERYSAVRLSDEQNEILKQEGCVFNDNDRPDYAKNAKSCALSHLQIIQRAKLMQYKNVLIFEDDVFFAENLIQKLQKSINDLILQDKWDMFYIGCNPFAYKTVTENLSRSLGSYSAHCYAVNNCFYDTILNIPFRELPIIDINYYNLSQNPKNKIYMCSENLACQFPNFSDIEGRFVDYIQIIQERYEKNKIN